MNKNKIKLFIFIIVILILSIILFLLLSNKENNEITEVINDTKLEKLKNTILSSGYYSDENIKLNNENIKITINDEYDLFIKNNNYLIKIQNNDNNTIFCDIVDAINMSFGGIKGESRETCELTIKGAINLGGIGVEKYDNYSILTINYNEKLNLYNHEYAHFFDEIISVDEVNYIIDDKNYLFSSPSVNYNSETKTLSICGNLYHKNKLSTFIFKTYNDKKEEINSLKQEILIENNKYKTYCVNFENDAGITKYYSISLAE